MAGGLCQAYACDHKSGLTQFQAQHQSSLRLRMYNPAGSNVLFLNSKTAVQSSLICCSDPVGTCHLPLNAYTLRMRCFLRVLEHGWQ